MGVDISAAEDCGLEVLDLRSCPEFEARKLHLRDAARQMRGMQRIAHAFVESPETILQELANAAVELCDADSAGISLEIDQERRSDTDYFQWVATAGEYGHFLNAILPRVPSACGTCLERGQPQLFRVTQRFFDLMRIEAPTVTDGLLLPWQVEEMRGTIWIMAHGDAADGAVEECGVSGSPGWLCGARGFGGQHGGNRVVPGGARDPSGAVEDPGNADCTAIFRLIA